MGSLRPSGVVEVTQRRTKKSPPSYQARWSSANDSVTIKQYKVYHNEAQEYNDETEA